MPSGNTANATPIKADRAYAAKDKRGESFY